MHHGTSAALEFGVCYLKVKHLILLGHSQCGGLQALLNKNSLHQDDFITNWVSLVDLDETEPHSPDHYAKLALKRSRQHCLSFPWLKKQVEQEQLLIHLWFFDIKTGQIFTYSDAQQDYVPLP